jgi:hypothetical protein
MVSRVRRNWAVGWRSQSAGFSIRRVGSFVVVALVALSALLALVQLAGAPSSPASPSSSGTGAGASGLPPHFSIGSALTSGVRGPLSSKISDVNSSNWAGYADLATSGGGNITEVTGDWTIPIANCSNAPKKGSFEVQWVGIDGWTNDVVEQAGTLDYCHGPGATPQYYTWWEFYPYNDITFVNRTTGGDHVSATILYNPNVCLKGSCGVYTLIFSNFDRPAEDFQVTGNPTTCNSYGCEWGPDTSAECISEAPSGFGYPGYTPLLDYGTTGFTYCSATISGHFAGIGSQGGYAKTLHINEVDSHGKTLQNTGPLSRLPPPKTGGKSVFSITWERLR